MKRSTSVATLCMVTFLQAYLLVSVFPYAAYMAVLLWNAPLQHPTERQLRGKLPQSTANDAEGKTYYDAHPVRKFSIRERIHEKIPQTITVEDAGPYAALLATSFMIGRTFAALLWGHLADIYGRRWVLIVSLIGSGFASLRFGLVTRYGGLGGAVVARGVVGAWNSVVGVSKTLATELAAYDFNECNTFSERSVNNGRDKNGYSQLIQERQDAGALSSSSGRQSNQCTEEQTAQEKAETSIVGLVMSMRAWGFLVAPAIAGYLSDPLNVRNNYNHVDKDDTDHDIIHGLFYSMLEKYPYLLPNLLGAILCWATALAVFFCIPETLPESRSARLFGKDCLNWISKFWNIIAGRFCSFTTGKIQQHIYPEDKNGKSNNNGHYGSTECSNDALHDEGGNESTNLTAIWSRRDTRYHLLAYWFYSMVIIIIDEAFPLYCISRNNGLHGLSESDIGEILSISGLIFSLAQYKVYLWVVDKWGVHGSLYFGCWIGVLPVILIPIASVFAHIQYGSLCYLSLLMGLTKIFQSTFFSSITIATNRTVPRDMRSRVNGVGGMGAGIAKGIGPILVGFWMAYCLHWDVNGNDDRSEGLYVPLGSLVAFGGISCLGLLLLSMLSLLSEEQHT